MIESNLQNAVSFLYQKAIVDGSTTSTLRLRELANTCIAGLEQRGLKGAEAEVRIDGGGRPKDWDVGWKWAGKYRLVLSLKSILKNLSGTVPNRIDDLMGETANIQLYSPEIVTGYVMIIDVGQKNTRRDGGTWCDFLQERLGGLGVRRAPYWTPSTFEAYSLIRVDFSNDPKIISGNIEFERMLDVLVAETMVRNPGIAESI